ncbi:MAG: rubrerythrin [Planctomycetota bacterium]
MPAITGTRTEKNLLAAFAGESQARNRYTYFASQARKEGLMQISQVFAETADQEAMHAKRFFSHLEGGEVEITAAFPAGVIGDSAANLRAGAAGEHHEWSTLYPGFAGIAREEGFNTIAALFDHVSVAEKQHERRYLGLLANVEAGTVFARSEPVVWRCLKCGYLHEGTAAPPLCPACAHPQGWFEILAENW